MKLNNDAHELCLTIYWFARARFTFAGPPRGVISMRHHAASTAPELVGKVALAPEAAAEG